MSSSKSQASGGGIGFVGVLTVAFVVLKLVGVISWPWLWVLSPLWISALLAVALIVLMLIGILIASLVKSRKR